MGRQILSGILYVVGTPIGNLGDFSQRAIETLSNVDFVAAEDTRVTIKLLNKFNIKKPLISYHEHSKSQRANQIISKLLDGENAAIVSDAGMPCISDPGEKLINLCIENNIDIKIIPGPTAAISALCLSGLNTSRFAFYGFLSTNRKNRLDTLLEVKNLPLTLIFYEAPHKLISTLKDLLKYLGDRKITLAKELTKIHENFQRTTISDALKFFDETGKSPKGEYVLIVEGAKVSNELSSSSTLTEAVAFAKNLVKEGFKPVDAAKQAAKITNHKKNEIYGLLILEK